MPIRLGIKEKFIKPEMATDLEVEDAVLQEKTEREAAIAQEASDRIAADSLETSDRVAADNALDGRIDLEISDRVAADNALDNKINQEISDRVAAVSSEASARIAADNAEASTRASADTTLDNKINLEISNRISGDNTEASARIAADNSLSSRITQEVSDRTAGDLVLKNRLDALRSRVRHVIITSPVGTSQTFIKVGSRMIWIQSRNSFYVQGTLIYSATLTSGRSMELRVVNTSTGATIAQSGVINASGTYTLPVPSPTADCQLELQFRQLSGGPDQILEEAVYEFTTITGQ